MPDHVEVFIPHRLLQCPSCKGAGVLVRRPPVGLLCGDCEGPLADMGVVQVSRGQLQRASKERAHRRLRGDG
jgi:hypothetical protein